MQTGVFLECHLSKFAQFVVHLLLLTHLCLSAPGLTGTQREASVEAHSPPTVLLNPFSSGEEERRLLQSYIQFSLKDDNQGRPEINSREQEVFFLCHLHDYDRSGLLDGLEIMKLLSDYNSHHASGQQANELVVSMVDFLLQTQDLNQDGLLAPSELLSSSLPYTPVHTQDSNNIVHEEEKRSNPGPDEETGAVELTEQEDNNIQPHEEEQPQHEVKSEGDERMKQLDETDGQQLPEAPAADQDHQQEVPVHQGQPEI